MRRTRSGWEALLFRYLGDWTVEGLLEEAAEQGECAGIPPEAFPTNSRDRPTFDPLGANSAWYSATE